MNLLLKYFVVLILFNYSFRCNDISTTEILGLLNGWSEKFGLELWHFSEFVTRKKAVLDSYRQSDTITRDGDVIIKEATQKLKTLLHSKAHAVSRIMDAAANTAESEPVSEVPSTYQYVNSKLLISPVDDYSLNSDKSLIRKRRSFLNETIQKRRRSIHGITKRHSPALDGTIEMLNFEYSAVHVPVDVYDRDTDVIHAIKWSENLDSIFKNNLRLDPNIKLQYFGSSTGFLRFYPAKPWVQDPVDLYDCRTRSWYIEAASAPKDLVILIDNSGSMTGMRKEIARHIANNLLDTLGNNDYVNLFTFSNITVPLVSCFDNILVQANLGNIRQFKEALYGIETENIANFTDALTKSFKLLEEYRDNREGGKCNQALMIITDGVQYNYKEIFQKYNWQTLPHIPVRVFTYVIGREVSNVREVRWMACANRGFYVHLSSLAEVRQKVLHYVQVMARPLVLWNRVPQPIWSSFYAHIIDPKITNYLWRQFERHEQKERCNYFRKNMELPPTSLDFDKQFVIQQAKKQDHFDELEMYTLVTSVSKPIYDRRKIKAYTADLLGVAGIDVLLVELEQLIAPYQFGVNGYAFIVHNNGYILMHPELRPVFNGILKPAYNRVDMTELELTDYEEDQIPREFNHRLLELRNLIINQRYGKKVLRMKQYIDKMMRLLRFRRHYHYSGIEGTPFTLVITLPEPYGLWKLQQSVDDEIHRMRANNRSPNDYFSGSKWKIHPKWIYCKYLTVKIEHHFRNAEQELLHFFEKMMQPGWKWSHQKGVQCDRNLVQALVFDAKVTNWFNQNISSTGRADNEQELIRRFGITVAFLATQSGLMRWQDFPSKTRISQKYKNEFKANVIYKLLNRNLFNVFPTSHQKIITFTSSNKILKIDLIFRHFTDTHARSIDETWYKRAVNQYLIDNNSFVYSVPFFSGDDDDVLVTASSAIFVGKNNQITPIATVGYQFLHRSLHSIFLNITSNCIDRKCSITCQSPEIACYILDNNAYIFMSERKEETGQFFGSLQADIMSQLISDRIFEKIQMVDYQAVCFDRDKSTSFAYIFLNPFIRLKSVLVSISTILFTILKQTFAELRTMDILDDEIVEIEDETDEESYVSRKPMSKITEKNFDKHIQIKKTLPEPCDKIVYLYDLVPQSIPDKDSPYGLPWTLNCSRLYMAQKIPFSNLIMLIVNNESNPCRNMVDNYEFIDIWPTRVEYNMSLPCYQSNYNDFPRKHYYSCINHHENESQIEGCGFACNFHKPNKLLLFISMLIIQIILKNK